MGLSQPTYNFQACTALSSVYLASQGYRQIFEKGGYVGDILINGDQVHTVKTGCFCYTPKFL